jgi:muconolactone delta-isomerase
MQAHPAVLGVSQESQPRYDSPTVRATQRLPILQPVHRKELTVIFYMQMRWNIEGRLTLNEVWDLEIEESKVAKDGFKILHMYKVAGQRRVIAIVETESAENLDRMILGRLPMREVLEFETIWPLRSFDGFLEDCKTHFGTKELSA